MCQSVRMLSLSPAWFWVTMLSSAQDRLSAKYHHRCQNPYLGKCHRVPRDRDWRRLPVHSNTVIGADGFGYANDRGQWVKIPQLGSVIIGDRVEIGSCTTIDRGALENTVIGNGVIIDNQCQIAHNVIIGDNTAVAGGVIMAGSLKIGRNCMIGGASVINGHMEICDRVVVTGMGMVMRPITEPVYTPPVFRYSQIKHGVKLPRW